MRDRLRRWGRLAVVDVTPLRRVPAFRWLFAGSLVVQAGRNLTVVAAPFQVYELTGSTLMVGLLGLAQFLPLLAVSMVGGTLVDALDRRKVLVVSQLLLAATGAGLFWNALLDEPAVWPIFLLVGLNAGISAVDYPARQALLPTLVGDALLPSALALNQTLVNLAKAGLPALGGVLIATAGISFSYATEAVMFVLGALLMYRVPTPGDAADRPSLSRSSIVEGFAFLKSRKTIQAALLADLNAMVLSVPTALFPAMGIGVFGGDAATVGLLHAAPGMGALVAALTSGWVAFVRRFGRGTIVAIIVWGVAVTGFGLTVSLPLALVLLAIAGAADVFSAIFRNAIVQFATPDTMRGRMSSMHTAVSAGGPRLGDLRAGVVAEATSEQFAVVSGGVACIIGALLIARWAPNFYEFRHEPGAAAPAPS